jgi:hypothetical protein
MPPQVEITLLTFAHTHRWSFGAQLVNALREVDPKLAPQRAGWVEKQLKDVESDEDLRRWWVDPRLAEDHEGLPTSSHDLLWRTGGSLRSLAMVKHGLRNQRGQVSPSKIRFSAVWKRPVDFEALFENWLDLSTPFLAMLHLFTPPEQIFLPTSTVGEWDDFRREWVNFQHASYGYLLEPSIPNLTWAMAFGGEYAREVDVEGLRGAGISVEAMGDGWLVRLTPGLADVADNFEGFVARRQLARRFFRDDLFLVRDEPGDRSLAHYGSGVAEAHR